MNQDFQIQATPALARRLVLAGTLCNVDIDPEIRRIAEEGLLRPEQVSNPQPAYVALLQRVIDSGPRCIVPASADSRRLALEAARLSGSPTWVMSYDPLTVKRFAKQIGLEINVLTHDSILDYEVMRAARTGLLILEKSDRHKYLMREFARVIVLSTDIHESAQELWPEGPFDLSRPSFSVKSDMRYMRFATMDDQIIRQLLNIYQSEAEVRAADIDEMDDFC